MNGSGNGPDLVYIDTKTKTIVHIEVKSTWAAEPTMPKGDPNQRFEAWIKGAAGGKISGKSVSSEDQAFAKQIKTLMDQGYAVDNKVMVVYIPKQEKSDVLTDKSGSISGTPVATLHNWTGNGQFSPDL